MVHVLIPLVTVLCLVSPLFPEASAATLRATARRAGESGDDDGGDDGGAGGLAGALSGLMGGGAGGGGADDDDDPNMVGSGKKKKAKAAGGVDVGGLEKGLATGGVGGLMSMLKAMRAAQSPSDTHIKKGSNGEEMYDFRDLDDGFSTTREPISVTDKFVPLTTPAGPAVSVPDLPTVALPGKGGKWVAPKKMPSAFDPLGAERAQTARNGRVGKRLVVWPPPATQQLAQSAPTMAFAQPNGMPFVPIGGAQLATSGLYQSLAMMRQNMEVLMNQAATMGGGSGSTSPMAIAELDKMSQNFTSYERKMTKEVDTLESENAAMKKQLDAQAQEMKALEQEKEKHEGDVHKIEKSEVHKSKQLRKPSSSKAVGNKDKKQQTHKGKKAKAHLHKAMSLSISKTTITYAAKPWDATFHVHLDGKAGGTEHNFTVRVHPEWAPAGAKRFQDILHAGVMKDSRFFRVIPGFMVQWGIPGVPKVAAMWMHKRIPDDPVQQTNKRGTMTFATSGPNSRTTQMFINYADNDFLDKQGFAPFAEVLGDGMKVVESIQAKYKEKPNQNKIQHHGNKYLMRHFPELSFVDHVDSTLKP